MYMLEGEQPPLVIAYADNITILLTSTSDIPKPQRILHLYERVTRALNNIRKSTALRLGFQDTALNCCKSGT
jgi:hypothetical protein